MLYEALYVMRIEGSILAKKKPSRLFGHQRTLIPVTVTLHCSSF